MCPAWAGPHGNWKSERRRHDSPQTARTVRELAIARQKVCALDIDLDHGGFGVSMQSSREPRMQPVQVSWLQAQRWPNTVKVGLYRTPDGLAPVGGTQRLVFHPDGTSSGASLRLIGEGGEYTVLVHPHSGRVVLADGRDGSLAPDEVDLGD